MSARGAEFEIRGHARIADIGAADWNRCAAGEGYGGNPFVSFEFLEALEESGCVAPRTGWGPQHLTAHDAGGRIIGVMPLYLKGHSQGEYVFDHAWADAYQRAGGRYYPKLQSAVPFSPVTGPRLLSPEPATRAAVGAALAAGALELCARAGASSLHVTFPLEEEWRALGGAGLLLRQDQQYHWLNAGYEDFEGFLGALSSNRRKTIRRERRDAVVDLEIEVVEGDGLEERHWDAFYAFYLDTGGRKWGRPYLNRGFFSLLGERLRKSVVLVLARRGERYLAGALNLRGGDALYGRHWGCLEDIPFLHFELCYYQAIDYAIRNRLSRVEAGAQGSHKIARGYLPVPVYSAHYIADPALRGPVARYLAEERPAVEAEMAYLAAEFSPFRAGQE